MGQLVEEEGGPEEGVAGNEIAPQGRQHEPEVLHAGVGQGSLKVLLGQAPHQGVDRSRKAQGNQGRPHPKGRGAEPEGRLVQPKKAKLGHGPGEKGGDGADGHGVGPGKPPVEGEEGRLDPEAQHQTQPDGILPQATLSQEGQVEPEAEEAARQEKGLGALHRLGPFQGHEQVPQEGHRLPQEEKGIPRRGQGHPGHGPHEEGEQEGVGPGGMKLQVGRKVGRQAQYRQPKKEQVERPGPPSLGPTHPARHRQGYSGKPQRIGQATRGPEANKARQGQAAKGSPPQGASFPLPQGLEAAALGLEMALEDPSPQIQKGIHLRIPHPVVGQRPLTPHLQKAALPEESQLPGKGGLLHPKLLL